MLTLVHFMAIVLQVRRDVVVDDMQRVKEGGIKQGMECAERNVWDGT